MSRETMLRVEGELPRPAATPAGWEAVASGCFSTPQDESRSFYGGPSGCEAGDSRGPTRGVEGAMNRAPTNAGALS
jgi:hypothetical protein